VKIRLVNTEIICLIYFKERNDGCMPFTFVNSGVTGPKFTKFTICSQIITDKHFQMNMAILQSISECQGDE